MLECGKCEKQRRCQKKYSHARAVWLSMAEGTSEPVCDEFEERKAYWRADEWCRYRQGELRRERG